MCAFWEGRGGRRSLTVTRPASAGSVPIHVEGQTKGGIKIQ